MAYIVIMKLVGKIEDLGLGEILQIVSFSQKSGILWLNSQKRVGSIVFKNGLVIRASSSFVKEGIGEFMVKMGTVEEEKLKKAREIQRGTGFTETVGEILLKNFNINPELIENAARALIEKAIYSFFHWRDGSFVFELKEFAENEEAIKNDTLQYTLTSGVNPQFLSIEGARLYDEAMRKGAIKEPEEVKTSQPYQPAEPSLKPLPKDADAASFLSPDFFKELEGEELIDSAIFAESDIEESKGLRLLKEMLEELSRPLSMSEIVLLIIRFSSEMMNRAVVFAVKSGNIVGLGQCGIELKAGIADKKVRKMKIPLNEPSILREAINKKERIVKRLDAIKWNEYIAAELGGYHPQEVYVSPVVIHGKVALILYGDNAITGEKIGDTSTLEIFLAQTRIALERLILERKLAGAAGAAI